MLFTVPKLNSFHPTSFDYYMVFYPIITEWRVWLFVEKKKCLMKFLANPVIISIYTKQSRFIRIIDAITLC